MLFSGHAKSIKISQNAKAADQSEVQEHTFLGRSLVVRSNEISPGVLEPHQSFAKHASQRQELPHGKPTINEDRRITIEKTPNTDNDIVDDRGNQPTSSLWVGNTPLGITAVQLATEFGRFGTVISTKPWKNCSFVNFGDVESAVRAWKACHEQAIFGSGQLLYVRFTTTESQAKQAKDGLPERKNSTKAKPCIIRRESSHETRKSHRASFSTPSNENIWPNGPPPTGPKSHQREISPPPLRRADVYRPTERSLERNMPDIYRPRCERDDSSDRDERSRGRDDSHASKYHRAHSRTRSLSLSPSDSGSRSPSLCTPRQNRAADSPLPWERRTSPRPVQDAEFDGKVRKAVQRARELASSMNTKSPALRTKDDKSVDSTNVAVGSQSPYSPQLQISITEQMIKPHSTSVDASNRSMLVSGTSLTTASPTLIPSRSKSPSARLCKRARREKDETCSTISEKTTSTKSSLRRKKCADCQKSGSDLSPLTSCARCPRRYHSGCGGPRSSLSVGKMTFICGRCVRTGRVEPEPTGTSIRVEEGESQLASPPLSHDNDFVNVAPTPKRDLSGSRARDRTITSFFKPLAHSFSTSPADAHQVASLAVMRKVGDQIVSSTVISPAARPNLPSTIDNPETIREDETNLSEEKILGNLNKYKSITCHWWRSKKCWLDEAQCLYAHNDTGLYTPDLKHRDRRWTCWQWLHGDRCSRTEEECYHAHLDTGLHAWKDGKASLKHITCFWWIKSGSCKFSAEDCRYAHRNTGVYSHDPSDKRFRGAAITTTKPVPTSGILSRQRSFTQNPTKETGVHVSSGASEGMSGDVTVSHATILSPNTLKDTRYGNFAYSPTTATQRSFSFSRGDKNESHGQRPPSAQLSTPMLTPTENMADTPFKLQSDDAVPVYARSQRNVSLSSLDADDGTPTNRDSMSRSFSSLNDLEGLPPQRQRSLKVESAGSPILDKYNMEMHIAHARVRWSANSADFNRLDQSARERNEAAVSKDPRRHLRAMFAVNSEPSKMPAIDTCGEKDVQPTFKSMNSNLVDNVLYPDSSSNNIHTSAGSKTKKCVVCSKIVFNDTLCRACREDKTEPANLSPATLKQFNSQQKSTDIQDEYNILESASDMVLDDFDAAPTKEIEETPTMLFLKPNKPSSKRSLSGDNMFIQNKRPKSSMMFSTPPSRSAITSASSSLIRMLAKHVHANEKPMTPTLEQLTEEARLRKGKSLNWTKEMGEGHEAVVKHTTEPEDSSPILTLQRDESAMIATTQFKRQPQSIEPPSIPNIVPSDVPYELPATVLPESHGDSTVSAEDDSIANKLSFYATRAAKACRECNQKHKRCTHAANATDNSNDAIVNQMEEHAPVENPPDTRTLPPATESQTIVPCRTCKTRRRKCLHDAKGIFDPERCYRYIRDRNSKPDSGRSRAEWQQIMDAAAIWEEASDDNASYITAGERSDMEDVADLDLDQSTCVVDSSQTSASEGTVPAIGMMDSTGFSSTKTTQPTFSSYLKDTQPSQAINVRPISFVESRNEWTADKERAHLEKLAAEGIEFDSDSDEESHKVDRIMPRAKERLIIDPLHVPPKSSRNLYEVCPELHPEYSTRQPRVPQPKVSRKREWKTLRLRQFRDRRAMFGNPHWTVDRQRPETTVRAVVERYVLVREGEVPAIQTREECVTFRQFLGAPDEAVACLTADGKTLAYRDVARDNALTTSATSTRGFAKRNTEEEKFPVYGR